MTMKQRHTHNMQPNRTVLPTLYTCNSCGFKCTPHMLGYVLRNPQLHNPRHDGQVYSK